MITKRIIPSKTNTASTTDTTIGINAEKTQTSNKSNLRSIQRSTSVAFCDSQQITVFDKHEL